MLLTKIGYLKLYFMLSILYIVIVQYIQIFEETVGYVMASFMALVGTVYTICSKLLAIRRVYNVHYLINHPPLIEEGTLVLIMIGLVKLQRILNNSINLS